MTFICTHNSRRSHFGQVWAAVAAAHFGLENITTFSGGTEATAFNPRAVAALERAGFSIENPGGDNPKYKVRFGEAADALTCFSKKYDDASNPQKGFVAVMTCSDADRNCPIVPGAVARFATPYVDPKEADNTPQETARYDERCKQIATEMLYLMGKVHRK
jgi:arsenate reductase